MAYKQIIDLPESSGITNTTVMPTQSAAGTTEKATAQQFRTYLTTGNISFGNGAVSVDSTGKLDVPGGRFGTGSTSYGNSYYDATVGNGSLDLVFNGIVQFVAASSFMNVAGIGTDGSAWFAASNVTIDGNGTIAANSFTSPSGAAVVNDTGISFSDPYYGSMGFGGRAANYFTPDGIGYSAGLSVGQDPATDWWGVYSFTLGMPVLKISATDRTTYVDTRLVVNAGPDGNAVVAPIGNNNSFVVLPVNQGTPQPYIQNPGWGDLGIGFLEQDGSYHSPNHWFYANGDVSLCNGKITFYSGSSSSWDMADGGLSITDSSGAGYGITLSGSNLIFENSVINFQSGGGIAIAGTPVAPYSVIAVGATTAEPIAVAGGNSKFNALKGNMTFGPTFESNAGFPVSPVAGQAFLNTSDGHFYAWNGTAWKQLDN